MGAPPPPPGGAEGSSDSTGRPTTSVTTTTTTDASDTEIATDEGTTASVDDSSGSSTTGPPASTGVCTHLCKTNEDCTIDDGTQYACDGDTCVDPNATPCSSDGQCVALLSGWNQGPNCNEPNDCRGSESCIGVGGNGHCVPGPGGDGIGCEDLGLQTIETVDVSGQSVNVCGYANASCGEDGQCTLPCQDGGCDSPSLPLCNPDTSQCECTADIDCMFGQAGDLCIDGQCRCSDDAACEDTARFLGGTVTCLGSTP